MLKSCSFIHSFNSQMFYWMPDMYHPHFRAQRKNVEQGAHIFPSLQTYSQDEQLIEKKKTRNFHAASAMSKLKTWDMVNAWSEDFS